MRVSRTFPRTGPVDEAAGEPADIGPGDTAVFPRGWTGTWQIHETIRKLYVLF
jgi:uncharacterized cupin superfamily protein